MVHALVLRGRETGAVKPRALGCRRVVDGRHVHRVLAVALAKGPPFITVARSAHANAVTQPQLAVGQVDQVAHAAALWQVVVIFIHGIPFGRDAHARIVGRELGHVELCPAVRRVSQVDVGPAAEQDGGLVVVGGRQGEHDGCARSRVDALRVRHVGQGDLGLRVNVVQDGRVAGLQEEAACLSACLVGR